MTAPDMVDGTATVDDAYWLHAAQAAVRRYCGWHVAPSAPCSGTVSTTGAAIIALPVRHITAVASLSWSWGDTTVDAVLDTETGLVQLARAVPAGVARLSYDVTAGYDPAEVPDVTSVVIQIARRARATGTGLVRTQTVNNASVTYAGSGYGAPAVTLLAAERAVLDPYRIRTTVGV